MSREHRPEDLLAAALAGLLPDAAPPPEVAGCLRATLLARIGPPPMRVLRAEDGEWQALVPGIRIKRLRSDAADGSETTLWRVEPGARIPPHRHHLDEECLVIEGSIEHAGVEYRAGDFLLAFAGRDHGVFTSPRGATLLIRGERLPRLSPAVHD